MIAWTNKRLVIVGIVLLTAGSWFRQSGLGSYYHRMFHTNPNWASYRSLNEDEGGDWLFDREDGSSVTVDDVAFGFELIMGRRGVGNRFLGIASQQAFIDAMTLQDLFVKLSPDLIVEVGTFCGGSSLLFAHILTVLGLPSFRVLTIDSHDHRGSSACAASGTNDDHYDGFSNPLFDKYVGEGKIVRHVLKVYNDTNELTTVVSKYAADAKTVFVSEDSCHYKDFSKYYFYHLAKFVTPGSYYLVQDTRLDRVCEFAQRARKNAKWSWRKLPPWLASIQCGGYVNNGPGTALRQLAEEGALSKAGFVVDRKIERYHLTQHPGGWLRKLKEGEEPMKNVHP